jgi:hypothetical protein
MSKAMKRQQLIKLCCWSALNCALLLLLLLQVSVFNVYQRDGASNTPLFPGHAVEVRIRGAIASLAGAHILLAVW